MKNGIVLRSRASTSLLWQKKKKKRGKKRKKNLSLTIHVQHKHMERDLMTIYN